MQEKYKNKYRIKSTRLQNWDYGWNGKYFITICTGNREHYFGEIVAGKMELTKIGEIAKKYWYEIPHHFTFVKLGEFVVMPNHIHGILIIDKTVNERNDDTVNTVDTIISDTRENVNMNNKKKRGGKNPKWKPNTLGTIINQYKRICTINARKTEPDFSWQSRFYEHIIRNKKSFNNISEYIVNNPLNWKNDKFKNKNHNILIRNISNFTA